MKKILVLTDFSENSVNAYRYAVQLACQVDANILLVFSSDGEGISLTKQMQYSQMLHSFAKRYACDSRQKNNPHHLECLISGDAWAQAIPLLIQVHQPDMVVAGSGLLTHLQKETEVISLQLFEQCPIIWVPEKANYQPLKDLVFVTDFTDQDPAVIDLLERFAGQVKAAITLLHFYSRNDRNHLAEIKKSGAELHWILKNTQAKYIFIEEEDMIEGLEDYAQHNPVDLFILATKDSHLTHHYFQPSYLKTQSCQTAIPLLNLYQEKKKACAGNCSFCHHDHADHALAVTENI